MRPSPRAAATVLAILSALLAAPLVAAEPDVEVYSRDGCPRCADAHRFLEALAHERPGLTVVTHDVVANPAARARLQELTTAHGHGVAGVPSFLVRGRFLVGFASAETTGAAIRAALDAAPADPLVLPLLGPLDPARLGLPLFTIAVGLLDGFNPCATWVLLFLLSLLVNLRDRARMLLVAGTFVVVSAAAYFVFMMAWLNAFLLLGISRPVEVTLALVALGVGALNVKDAVFPGVGPSVGIPDAARPGIYARTRRILAAETLPAALAGAAVLAVLVNVLELACTAGLPALYTRILTRYELSWWRYVGYLLLYDLAYMLDDAVLVAIGVLTLSRMKLQAGGARALKLLSGGVMVALGGVLLLAPQRLAALAP